MYATKTLDITKKEDIENGQENWKKLNAKIELIMNAYYDIINRIKQQITKWLGQMESWTRLIYKALELNPSCR